MEPAQPTRSSSTIARWPALLRRRRAEAAGRRVARSPDRRKPDGDAVGGGELAGDTFGGTGGRAVGPDVHDQALVRQRQRVEQRSRARRRSRARGCRRDPARGPARERSRACPRKLRRGSCPLELRRRRLAGTVEPTAAKDTCGRPRRWAHRRPPLRRARAIVHIAQAKAVGVGVRRDGLDQCHADVGQPG